MICLFYGIAITMYYKDHQPPHFHVTYAGTKAIIDIRTLEVIEGDISRRTRNFVLEWAKEHQAELMENWELCTQKRQPRQIAPLA